jgi:hypothetical protein
MHLFPLLIFVVFYLFSICVAKASGDKSTSAADLERVVTNTAKELTNAKNHKIHQNMNEDGFGSLSPLTNEDGEENGRRVKRSDDEDEKEAEREREKGVMKEKKVEGRGHETMMEMESSSSGETENTAAEDRTSKAKHDFLHDPLAEGTVNTLLHLFYVQGYLKAAKSDADIHIVRMLIAVTAQTYFLTKYGFFNVDKTR